VLRRTSFSAAQAMAQHAQPPARAHLGFRSVSLALVDGHSPRIRAMMFTKHSPRGAFMPSRSDMTWEKSSEDLIDLFTSLAPTAAGVQQKKMFGWPCSFVNGNLFAGLHKQNMIFRLSEADQAVFLKTDGAAEFEPMPGRKMRGYVILSEPLRRDRKELARWIDRSLRFAAALLPRPRKRLAHDRRQKASAKPEFSSPATANESDCP
jgi:TfoX/Sxy family transcriptional regulator of competence genes